MSLTKNSLTKGGIAGAALLAFTLFLAYFYTLWPTASDFEATFYNVVTTWREGIAPYDVTREGAVLSFQHPPWTFVALLPYAFIPYEAAETIQRILITWAALFSAWVFVEAKHPLARVALIGGAALVNTAFFHAVFLGQLAVLVPLGAALWWRGYTRDEAVFSAAGCILLMASPPNTIPIAMFFLWLLAREGRWRHLAWAAGPAIAVVLLSLVIDPQWPVKWYAGVTTQGLAAGGVWLTTIWRGAQYLDWPAIVPTVVSIGVLIAAGVVAVRYAWDEPRYLLSILIATLYFISPYLTTYRYMPVFIIVWTMVAARRPWLGGLLLILGLVPAGLLVIGPQVVWLTSVFAGAAWAAAVWHAAAEA